MTFLLFKVILLNTFAIGFLKYACTVLVFFLVFLSGNMLLEKLKENKAFKDELLINRH
jgi:hypothetical protein